MRLRASLDAVAMTNKNYHCPSREMNPGRPSLSLVTMSLYLLYATDVKHQTNQIF